MTFKKGSIEDRRNSNKPKHMSGAPGFIRNVSGLSEEEYDLDSYQPGMSGEVTVLPRVSFEGGIKNSENPYGEVVMGKSYKGVGEDMTIDDIQHSMPTERPRAGVDTKSIQTQEEEDVSEEVLAVVDPETLQVASEPADPVQEPRPYQEPEADIGYLQSMAYGNPPSSPLASAVPVQQELLNFKRKRIRVRISGSKFGNYKGHYVHVVDGPDYLILFYDVDDAGYEPPYTDKGDPITVRCEDKEHKVYYMGMDFDLKLNNLGMQIYIKHKE